MVHWIPWGTKIVVIPNFFDLVHLTNTGAAFGFLSDLPSSYRFTVLITLSLIVVGLIGYYYFLLPVKQVNFQIPIAMILGGAAGNLCGHW